MDLLKDFLTLVPAAVPWAPYIVALAAALAALLPPPPPSGGLGVVAYTALYRLTNFLAVNKGYARNASP